MKTHLGLKWFQCRYNDCDRSFSALNWLKLHINEVHKNLKPFECNYNNCRKTFSTKSILNNHIKRYLDLKLFECQNNECDRSFVTLNEFKRHSNKVHENLKLFEYNYNNCRKR
jgi:uncharacterized Zn-finger protein